MSSITFPETLLDRTIARPRPAWVTAGLLLLLVSLAWIAAYADGQHVGFFRDGHWRGTLNTPATIGYILIIAPWIIGEEQRALGRFRSVVMLDDESLAQLIEREYNAPLWQEMLALAIGAAVGLVPALLTGRGDVSPWLWRYQVATSTVALALLAWVIQGSLVSARTTSTLMQQPLQIDLFDLAPFEAMGRVSLILALSFMGGSALVTLFVVGQPGLAAGTLYWLSVFFMVLVSLVVFFLSMRSTHHVLAVAKARALADVRGRIPEAYRRFTSHAPESEGSMDASSWLRALLAYEQRIEAARTWPYNTGMLRTLLLSVLIPIGTALLRHVIG